MKREFTITVYTENGVGLINRISALFFKKKINIGSIHAGSTELDSIQRFTIGITEAEENVRKVMYQIEKQVDVLQTYYKTNAEQEQQETVLYKVPTRVIDLQPKVERLLNLYKASPVVIRNNFTVFEITGPQDELTGFAQVLELWGLKEFTRSS